jgi:small subunit ribosomal protein S9
MMWDALVGREAKGDYYDPITWEVFLQAGQTMNQAVVDRLDVFGLAVAEIELQGLPVIEALPQEWSGWGRYKSAVAKAMLRPGSGELRVNGQSVWEYFRGAPSEAQGFLRRLLEIGDVEQALAQMDGIVRVEGSKPESKRQARAVTHAVSRALADQNSSLKKRLKQLGFGGVKVKDNAKS